MDPACSVPSLYGGRELQGGDTGWRGASGYWGIHQSGTQGGDVDVGRFVELMGTGHAMHIW